MKHVHMAYADALILFVCAPLIFMVANALIARVMLKNEKQSVTA
jgi:hypothetical protein